MEYSFPVEIKAKPGFLSPIVEAKVDPGAIISVLFFDENEEKTRLEADRIREVPASLVKGLVAAGGERLTGYYAWLGLRLIKEGRAISIPVLVAQQRMTRRKLLLGSMGFLAMHNLVLCSNRSGRSKIVSYGEVLS